MHINFKSFGGIIFGVVNLVAETCSYSKFRDLKPPYQHVTAAISYSCYLIGTYNSDLYLKET